MAINYYYVYFTEKYFEFAVNFINLSSTLPKLNTMWFKYDRD
jgi:hypothetical protein